MKANVVIIGGGPAGIITALTAKSVYPEKTVCLIKEIGDGVIPCAIPYMMHTLTDPIQNAMGNGPLQNAGIEIIVDRVVSFDIYAHSVKLESGRVLSYERLVIATGTEPELPAIPGIQKTGVFTVKKSMPDMIALRDRARLSLSAAVLSVQNLPMNYQALAGWKSILLRFFPN